MSEAEDTVSKLNLIIRNPDIVPVFFVLSVEDVIKWVDKQKFIVFS